MQNYPAKILVAFGEAVGGNKEIHNWLLKNNYPELAVLSEAIRGSDEAVQWLLKNKLRLFTVELKVY